MTIKRPSWTGSINYPFQGLAVLILVLILSLLLLGRLELWAAFLALLLGVLVAADFRPESIRLGRASLRLQISLASPTHLGRSFLGLLGLAGLMALLAFLATWTRSDRASYLDAALLWIASMALVVYAAIRQDGGGYRIGLAREELALVGLLFVGSLVLRFLGVDQLPRNFGGDEGSMALPGREILQGRPINPFGTGWYSVPNLFSYVQAGAMAVFGDTVFGARAQAALVGALSVVATYFLGRCVLGRTWAGVAAFLLTVNHMHLFFSRLSSNMIEDTLLAPAVLLLLLVGLSSGSWLAFAAAGIGLGFGQYFYFGGRLLPVMAAGVVAFAVVQSRGRVLGERWPHLALMVLSFLVTFSPLAGYYLQHPADYLSRVNQVSIFQSGWLERQAASTGLAPWLLILDQVRKTFLVFVVQLPGGWYHIGQPLMDNFNAFLLFAGLFASFAKSRRIEHFSVLFAFLMIVLGVALTENAPMVQRMVIILPFAALLQAEGLGTAAQLLEGAGAGRLTSAVVAVALLVAGYFSLNTFMNVSLTFEYGYTNTTVATELAYYLRSRPDRPTVYFHGDPRMRYSGFSTLPFIAPDAKGVDVEKGKSALPGALSDPAPRLFVFLPERQGEMAAVTSALPGGKTYQFRKASGELLFVLYDADAREP